MSAGRLNRQDLGRRSCGEAQRAGETVGIEKEALGVAVCLGAELGGEIFGAPGQRGEPRACAAIGAAQEQRGCRLGRERDDLDCAFRKAVDRFFEDVMVMAQDERIRDNRLTLLGELLKEFTTVADFSEIGAEERR